MEPATRATGRETTSPFPPRPWTTPATFPFHSREQVRAAGRSIRQVQKDIEERLAKRAIEPQVVISVQEQNATDVAVFGDAANGSFKQRITPGGERILDVIAKAGVKDAAYEIYVTLKRGNTRATVYLPNLIARPEENIFVRPGDIVYLYRDPQDLSSPSALSAT